MASVRVTDEIPASVEDVWACFEDFGDVAPFAPGNPRVDMEGRGVGAVRTITLEDGARIRERLEAFDAARKTFTYAMTESVFPFKDYRATVTLAAAGPGRTAIEWRSTFEPTSASAADVVGMIENLYRTFIAQLKQTAPRRATR